MAAFDMEEAARQGRGATIPPAWTRFPVSRGAIWTNVLVYSGGGLFVLALAVYLLLTGALPGDTSSSADSSVAPFEFVALVICGFLFLAIGLRMLAPLIKSNRYFFLITTDGFVWVANQKLLGLPFTEVSSAFRQAGLLGGKLVVFRREGKPLVLPIGRLYTTRTVREMEEALTAALQPASSKKRDKRR